MSEWHGGKGSKRRNTNEKLYADNWEHTLSIWIFASQILFSIIELVSCVH